MEEENTAVHYRTFRRASKHVCQPRGATLKTSLREYKLSAEQEELESRFLNEKDQGQDWSLMAGCRKSCDL
jgi:hypothetical protein